MSRRITLKGEAGLVEFLRSPEGQSKLRALLAGKGASSVEDVVFTIEAEPSPEQAEESFVGVRVRSASVPDKLRARSQLKLLGELGAHVSSSGPG